MHDFLVRRGGGHTQFCDSRKQESVGVLCVGDVARGVVHRKAHVSQDGLRATHRVHQFGNTRGGFFCAERIRDGSECGGVLHERGQVTRDSELSGEREQPLEFPHGDRKRPG